MAEIPKTQNEPSTSNIVPAKDQRSQLALNAPLKRKPLISPTSSFVDFAELKTEIYNQEDKEYASLYDPFAERNIKKPTTTFETCVHMLKGVIGAGVLAIPMAFKNSGVTVGVPGTLLLGGLCVYGVHTMLRTQYIQCQRLRVPFLTLPRSLKIAFLNGPKPFPKIAFLAPYYVDIFLVGNQIGLCATFIGFIADSIKNVLKSFCSCSVDRRYIMLVILLPILFTNYVRNLKKMMPISFVADLFIVAALGCCFYYIFGTGPFSDSWVYVESPKKWPLFLAQIMFSLEAIGVMIVLEHNMEKPQYFLGFKGIMPWSMFVVLCLYMGVGLCSYLKYGQETKGTIILSLPQNEIVANIAQIMIALAIFGSYPIQCYVGLEILWGNYIARWIKDSKKECIYEYILRTSFVITTFIIAILIEKVDLVISLVGALCLSSLGLVIPFLLELCTKWPDQLGTWKYILVKDILCIIFGFFVLILGTYLSVYEIVVEFNQ